MSKNCIKGVVNQKYFNNPRVSFEIDKIINEQDNPKKADKALEELTLTIQSLTQRQPR